MGEGSEVPSRFVDVHFYVIHAYSVDIAEVDCCLGQSAAWRISSGNKRRGKCCIIGYVMCDYPVAVSSIITGWTL
jgi:hypothetical protein